MKDKEFLVLANNRLDQIKQGLMKAYTNNNSFYEFIMDLKAKIADFGVVAFEDDIANYINHLKSHATQAEELINWHKELSELSSTALNRLRTTSLFSLSVKKLKNFHRESQEVLKQIYTHFCEEYSDHDDAEDDH